MIPSISRQNDAFITYDGTFEGLLTAIFDVYDKKLSPAAITTDSQSLLFGHHLTIASDAAKSERVFNGICRYGGIQTCDMLYHAFLSQADRIEMDIYRYLQFLFHYKRSIAGMMGEHFILRVRQMQRRVTHEAHRMLMFVRFEQAKDGTYFAPIAPEYDILRLIISHFKDRFADQPWIIYDTRRGYGAHFDGQEVALITIDEPSFNLENGRLPADIVAEQEVVYQHLWQTFFREIAIKERKNMRLQQNFMPKRFWKYLTEKRAK